jgi:hypothetical protein
MNNVISISKKSGLFRNFFATLNAKSSSKPEILIDSIKIIAVAIIKIASRYPKEPSTRCLIGKKCPEKTAPHIAANIKETDIGIFIAANVIKLNSIMKK